MPAAPNFDRCAIFLKTKSSKVFNNPVDVSTSLGWQGLVDSNVPPASPYRGTYGGKMLSAGFDTHGLVCLFAGVFDEIGWKFLQER